MDVPAAGWVVEGGKKPVASGTIGVKTMRGKKVALLVPVSEEVARSNAAGLYAQLSQDLPTAIARAFDHAAIHGKDLRTGGAGPFADYLLKTPNSVELGTAAASAGGMYVDLVNGEKKVVEAPACVIIPPHTNHSFGCAGETPVHLYGALGAPIHETFFTAFPEGEAIREYEAGHTGGARRRVKVDPATRTATDVSE